MTPKAYKVYDSEYLENGMTIVFADNAGKAKALARSTECCENSEYIDIRAQRVPEADGLYSGRNEINWYDDETRLFMVKELDWSCTETSCMCVQCAAKDYCSLFEEGTADDTTT